MRTIPVSLLLALSIGFVVACSDSSSPGGSSGDTPPAAPTTTRGDPAPIDPPGPPPPPGKTLPPGTPPPPPGTDGGPAQTESEPNNGGTTTELNPMTIPGVMTGKIDPANDVDIFGVSLTPGDFWEWTLTPTTNDLAPHLTVFDTAPSSLNPTRLVAGQPGGPAKLDHFVLRNGTFVAAVRDTRNVPTASGKGGPTYGYTLTATKKTIAPVLVAFPATKTGTLASLSSIDLFTFTGTGGKGFDITVKAERKVPASTLDSRLSLYDATTKQTLITNDDAPGTTDSQVGSATPSNDTFIVVLENEGVDPTDLSYEIDFTLRP